MVTVGPFYTSVSRRALSSGFESPLDGVDIPDETSPLLPPERTSRRTVFGRWKPARSSFLDDNSGLFLVATAEFFVSAMNATVKVLSSLDEPVPILEIILVRATITYVFSIAYMYWNNIPDPLLGPKGVRTLLVIRGFAGFSGLCGVFFSLQYLSLSDATVLTFIAPILTGVSGAVLLGESLSLRETLAGLCSFLGVVFISRPEFLFGSPQAFLDPSEVTPTQRMLSIIAALIGVLGIAGTFLALRAIGERAHILHSLTAYSSQCVLVSTLGIILFKVPLVMPTHTLGLAMLSLNTIFGVFGQVLLTMGFQRETAGRGALAVYTSIIFALVFELTIFHTTPSALSIIGTLMILSSAIYTTLTKETVIKPAADSASKRSLHGASPSDVDDYLEA